jgi:TPR repeat protein
LSKTAIAASIFPLFFYSFAMSQEVKQEVKNENLGAVLNARANSYSLSNPIYLRNKMTWDLVNGKYFLAAKYGNKNAMYTLGGNYRQSGDIKNSTEYYIKAADAGLFDGYYQAAVNYLKQTPADCNMAFPLLEKAIETKHHNSSMLIVSAHESGICKLYEPNKLFELLKNAKQDQLGNRIYLIGKYYYEGFGTAKDVHTAYAYLKIASLKYFYTNDWSKSTQKDAQNLLEIIEKEALANPEATAKSYNKLYEICNSELNCNYFSKDKLPQEVYAKLNPPNTAKALVPVPPAPPAPPIAPPMPILENATLYKLFSEAKKSELEIRRKAIFKTDYAAIRAYYEIPELEKSIAAQITIAKLYNEENNKEKSLEYYQKAANLGSGQAAYELGKEFIQNPNKCDEGVKLLKKARSLYVWQSAIELAQVYENGICNQKDNAAAIKEYEHAARYGHSPSQITLSLIYWNGTNTQKNVFKSYAWGMIGYYNNPQVGIFAPKDIKEARERAATQEASFNKEELQKAKEEIAVKCIVSTTCGAITDFNLIEMLK